MTQYFKRVADAKDRLLAELAELDMTHGDVHVVIPAVSQWMPVPGIEHVSVFHVPNPNGDGELYMNVVRMQPGASAENVKFAESTRMCCIDGHIVYNGRDYYAGQSWYIQPNETYSFVSPDGCVNLALFNREPYPVIVNL